MNFKRTGYFLPLDLISISMIKMALLLMIILLSATGTLVHSASNKTVCDFTPNGNSCLQNSCVQSPCTMLCGLKTNYVGCQQICRSSKCDALECRASDSCVQLCSQRNCGSMICDAKVCTQSCSSGNCSSMVCPKTVNNCAQGSAKEMACEANI